MSDDERPPLVSAEDWHATPPAVQQAFLSVVDMVHTLSAEVKRLRAQVTDLQTRLNQTSQNSSKPPSSDPPSAPPRPPKHPRGRPRGGQPGHPGHERPLAPADQVDTIVPLYPTRCPRCCARFPETLPDVAPVIRTQVWDLPARLIHVTEYQQHTVACPCCDLIQQAATPTNLPPGVFGPGVIALTAMFRRYRMSDREIVDCWHTVFGMPISLGSVVRNCQRMSMALEPLALAIRTFVQQQPSVHLDETRWREGPQKAWLWTAVTPQATSFLIDRSRSRVAFDALIPPQYRGIVISDRYSVYHHLPNQRRQLCWAHLIRDLRACLTRSAQVRRWADAILTHVQTVFTYWHWYQVTLIDQIHLQGLLAPVRAAIADQLRLPTLDDPDTETLRADLLAHWDALWTFSRADGVAPTNNAAERAIRPAVMWRKICFGTQSAAGSRFVERLLSVVATCRQLGRSVFAILINALRASWENQVLPDLFATP